MIEQHLVGVNHVHMLGWAGAEPSIRLKAAGVLAVDVLYMAATARPMEVPHCLTLYVE